MMELTKPLDLSTHSDNGLEQHLKQLSKQLSHQHKIISAIGAANPDYISIFNQKKEFIYVSPSLLKLWNKTRDQIIGKTYEQLGFPVEAVALKKAQLHEVFNGRVVSGANTYTDQFGKPGFYEYTLVPVFDDFGNVETVVSSMQDTTHKHNIEAEKNRTLEDLKDSETQFRNFADSISHLAWVTNAAGDTIWHNKRWYAYTGFSPEDAISRAEHEIIHPSQIDKAKEMFKESMENNRSFEAEFLLRGTNGKYRWFLTRATPVFNTKGSVIKWFGTHTDVDDPKRAADFSYKLHRFTSALAQSNSFDDVAKFVAEESRELFLATKILVCDVDYEKRRLLVNSVSGYSEPQLESISKYLAIEDEYPMQACVRTTKAIFVSSADELRHLWPLTTEVLTKSLSRAFCFLPLIYDGKVRTVLAASYNEERVFSDAEKNFLRAIAQQGGQALERARIYDALQNAIRSRDSFMGIASHELKTPLTSLKLQAQLLGKSFAHKPESVGPEKIKKFADLVVEQVGRLTTLVDDMLDISRIETGKLALHKENRDLCQVVRNVTERFATQFEIVGSTLDLQLPQRAMGFFDNFRIEQVLNNLLTNAIKYAPGRPIKISIQEMPKNKIQMVIQDRGPGIPKQDHLKIFQRFERLVSPNEVSGLGIGLFIAKQIVEAHNGTIWVESELGKGTTFLVELPTSPT